MRISFKMLAILAFVPLIQALGEQCKNPLSLWDKAACSVIDNYKYQPLCKPIRLFPGTAKTHEETKNVKGAIIMYHGYTACPDAFVAVAEAMRAIGFLVVVPLLPGHGIRLGYGCEVPGVCLKNGTNPSFLPVNKEGYMEWVDWSLDMLREEVAMIPPSSRDRKFHVGTIGLSAGGPLGTYAASRPNTPISKVLVVNPYFAFTQPALDFKVVTCRETNNPAKCVISFLLPALEDVKSTDLDSAKSHESYVSMYVGPFGILLRGITTIQKALGSFFVEKTLGTLLTTNYGGFMQSLWSNVRKISENGLLMVGYC